MMQPGLEGHIPIWCTGDFQSDNVYKELVVKFTGDDW